MKFKLVEKFDETRSMVQEYMYDAMDELNNASLEEYIQWFKSELTYYDDKVEQVVTDAYIEACDYGMIKGVEKTRLTSELKEYIESHTDIIDDTDELMNNCPEHLRHELQLALDVAELNESLNEELLTENKNGATDKPVSLRSLLDTALGWRLLKQLCYDETFKYGFTLSSNKRGQGGNQDNPLHHIMGTWDVDKKAELPARHHTRLHNRVRNVLISKLTSALDLSDLYKMYCSAFDGKPLSEKNLVKRFRAYEDFFRGLAQELQRINFYDYIEPTYVEQWDQMVSELS